MALLLLIITPLVAALASLGVRRTIVRFEIIASLAAVVESVAAILIAEQVVWRDHYDFGNFSSVDALGTIVMLTVAVVDLAATFYSIGYLREEVRKKIIGFRRVKQFFILLHLFLLAMFFAIVTVNPIMMWIAIEATTLSTAFLISFYNKPSAMEAAWKYLIINSIGLLFGFFGTLLFLTPARNLTAGTLVDWHTLSANAAFLDPMLTKMAFIFVLIGYGTKTGLAPMHTWLPDAHSKAPSPISALLSGALLNVALLAIVRFKIITDAVIAAPFSQNLLIVFGIASVLISAFIILAQKNYKRLFAYSSIEHMGIITLGIGFGGLGTFAALLHMIYHSLAKPVLFFSAGNVLLKYGSTKIANVRGVLSSLPTTGLILLLGFLAITGMPPFGMFITEVSILSAGIASHPVVVSCVLVLLALVFIGFLRHIVAMTLSREAEPTPAGELNYLTTMPAVFLLVLFIGAGLYLPGPIKSLVISAASSIH